MPKTMRTTPLPYLLKGGRKNTREVAIQEVPVYCSPDTFYVTFAGAGLGSSLPDSDSSLFARRRGGA